MPEEKLLTLVSPAERSKEIFRWTVCDNGETRDENLEVIEIISWLINDVDELSDNEQLLTAFNSVDRSSYTSVSSLCNIYNNTVTQKWKEWDKCGYIPKFINRKASREHVQFILLQCYNRAVVDPEKLNQYQPFSPQVYGETSFELISQMIDTVGVTAEDTFIDLGSGVGQVVLQVSACSDAKFCYGVEKAEYPAFCASNLDSEFRHWMAFYGKSYRPYMLEKGDFLSPECHERILTASVLFANNFAFGPEIDHQLKQKFANLKEGARIISSKAFCPLNFRITDRNLGDIGSIMHVHCLNPIHDAVSWTDKPFSYYVHTIDRSLLERYFSRLKNPAMKDDFDVVRRDRKGRIISEQNLKDLPNVADTLNHSRKVTSLATRRRPSNSPQAPTANRPRRSRSLGCSTPSSNPSSSILRRRTDTRVIHHVHSTTDTTTAPTDSTTGFQKQQRRSAPSNRSANHRKASRRSGQHGRAGRVLPSPTSSLGTGTYLEQSTDAGFHLGSLSLEQPGAQTTAGTHSAPATFPICPNSGHTSPSSSTPDDDAGSLSCPSDKSGKHRVFSLPSCDPLPYHQHCEASTPGGNGEHHVPRWSSSANSSTSSSSSCMPSIPSSRVTSSPTPALPDSAATGANSVAEQNQSSESSETTLQENSSDRCASSADVSDNLRLTLRLSASDYQVVTLTNGETSVANRRAVRKCRQSASQQSKPSATSPACRPHRSSKAAAVTASRRRRPSLRQRQRVVRNPVPRPSALGKTGGRTKLHGRVPRGAAGPPSDGQHNLNVLHGETVAQVRKKPSTVKQELLNEAGRNNCSSMLSFAAHYTPVELRSTEAMRQHSQQTSDDPNIGHCQQPVPLALTQYLELTKRVLMDQFALMRSPAYADQVRAQLAREQSRKTELRTRLWQLEQSIGSLHADGTVLLQKFMKNLGFLISTPSVFFSQARKLIKHHHTLEAKIARYRTEISRLTSANQDLVRRHQDEATRLLSTVANRSNAQLTLSDSSHDTNHLPAGGLLLAPLPRGPPPLASLIPPTLTDETLQRPVMPQSVAVATCERSSLPLSTDHSIPPPPQLTKVISSPPRSNRWREDSPHNFSSMATAGSFSLHKPFMDTATAVTSSTSYGGEGVHPVVRPLLIMNRSSPVPNNGGPVETSLPPPPPLLPVLHHRQSHAQLPSTASAMGTVSTGLQSAAQSFHSEHASLQDLITNELNRSGAASELPPPTLRMAAVPRRASVTSASSYSPPPPLALGSSQRSFLTTANTTPGNHAMHQFMLPPRKRQWDLLVDSSSANAHQQKLSRRQPPPHPYHHQHRSPTPGSCTPTSRGHESSGNLSPPTLSPGELGLPISVSPSSCSSSQCSPLSGLKTLQQFLYPPLSSGQYTDSVKPHLFTTASSAPISPQCDQNSVAATAAVPVRLMPVDDSRTTAPATPPLRPNAATYVAAQATVP